MRQTMMRVAAGCLALLCLAGLAGAADREYTIDGKVKAVDAEKYQVTITRDNGKETTVQIVRETEIRLDGERSNWNAIKKGQEVRCVFYLENKCATWFGIYETIDRPGK